MELENIIRKMKAGENVTIVAFGDSLTQGWMVRKGYINFIDEMLSLKYPESRHRIINRGIPGDTSDAGLYRLGRDVLDENPDLVLIQFALNDAYMGFSPGRLKKNILSMIERIKDDTSAAILLITSVMINIRDENSMAEKFYSILQEIAKEEDIPIALVHEYWKKMISDGIEHSSLVQGDQVHPTVEGYRLMAEAVMELF